MYKIPNVPFRPSSAFSHGEAIVATFHEKLYKTYTIWVKQAHKPNCKYCMGSFMRALGIVTKEAKDDFLSQNWKKHKMLEK